MAPRFATAIAFLLAFAFNVQADPDPKGNADILAAIKKGQEYLRNTPAAGREGDFGMSFVGGNGSGPACLAGLALIESGLKPSDKVLVNLAQAARSAALTTTSTYEISLLIMFLDRYGTPQDEPFIQLLTLRLMSGQAKDGGWSYSCMGYILTEVEQRQLHSEFTKGAKLVTPDPATPPKKAQPRKDIEIDQPPPPVKKDPPPKKEEKPTGGLHPLIKQLEKRGPQPRPGGGGLHLPEITSLDLVGDHSNTQFATVGLWCGRRHHVDVANALAAVDSHYRKCQGSDGGWAYTAAGGGSSPSMTCAGLMGLAMGFGAKSLKGGGSEIKVDEKEIGKDRIVADGLKHLGDYLAAAAAQEGGSGRQRFAQNELSRNLYFMWSLERVGMTYGLKTIGKVDWYDWGSSLLVNAQNPNGSWASDGFHSGSIENATSFALLFLSRANLAEDLSTSMQNKIKDPGTSSLKSNKNLDEMLGKSSKGSTGPRPNPGTTAPKVDPTPGTTKTDVPPSTATATDVKSLADALIAANPTERAELIRKYRDTTGNKYTDAMAQALAKLVGEGQIEVREALVQRLTRMKPATLNELMLQRDKELRRAAALACEAKGKKHLAELADSLIRLIGDEEAIVSRAAHTSLKTLSGKDFGPEDGASPGERGKAMLAWRDWWKTQAK
ncbi:MAG TPA: hypothetical protein VHR66_11270 [Gemmataceae bacterium]|jgi:hypothetical protein|nr:hypothetical protein [Gemmataceae bacterium]